MAKDETAASRTSAVLLDLDGTLVDSVYVHVVAWHDAFRARGYEVSMARVHAAIGLGSERLVPWVLGHHVEDEQAVSDDHKRRFLSHADVLAPTPGARALLDDLARRQVPFVVATSAQEEEREALLAGLGRDDLPLSGAEQVESSKPAAELLLSACRHLEVTPDHVQMVGDAPWDALAASRVGIAAVAVRCGGFSDAVLRDAGAHRVVDAPADLVGTL